MGEMTKRTSECEKPFRNRYLSPDCCDWPEWMTNQRISSLMHGRMHGMFGACMWVLFVETSLPDCMMNGGNNDAFSTRFCWILLAYLDRLVAT